MVKKSFSYIIYRLNKKTYFLSIDWIFHLVPWYNENKLFSLSILLKMFESDVIQRSLYIERPSLCQLNELGL